MGNEYSRATWLQQGLAVLIAVYGLAGVLSALNLARDIGRPFGGYLTFRDLQRDIVRPDVNMPSSWPGAELGLAQGGEILFLDGQPNTADLDEQGIFAAAYARPERAVSLVVVREGQVATYTIPAIPFSWAHYFELKMPDLISGLGFWLLALVVFRARPGDRLNQVFALACLMVGNHRWLSRSELFQLSSAAGRLLHIFFFINLSFLGAGLLHFALLFPRRSRAYSPRLLTLAYGLGLADAGIYTLHLLLTFTGKNRELALWLDRTGFYLNLVLVTAGILAVLLRFTSAWFLSANRRERHQNRIMMLGLLLSSPFIWSIWRNSYFAGGTNLFWGGLDLRYLFLAFPTAIAFVILRYQTFRGAPPLFLAVPVMTISALAAELLSTLWRAWQPEEAATPLPLFVPAFLLALALSLFWVTQSAWSGFLGRLLYRERHHFHHARQFGQAIISSKDLARLPEKMAGALVSALELEQAALWLWREEEPSFALASAAGDWQQALPASLPAPAAAQLLGSSGTPFRLQGANGSRPAWLQPLCAYSQAEIAVPLCVAGQPAGLMLLGRRWDQEIFDERELEALELVSHQAALFLLTARQVAELRQVPQRISAAQEREQLRIAQELHDTIQQFLGRLPFYLEVSRGEMKDNPAEADRILQQCVLDVEAAARTVRQIRSNLAPTQLQTGVLAPLANLVNHFYLRTGISTSFQAGPEVDQALGEEGRHALYRVVQQALDNVAVHAPTASQVKVTLACAGSRVQFNISDNGPGSSEAERAQALARGSFGLETMAARVGSVGGQFHFRSRPGEGTEVSGEMPARDGTGA